MVFPPELGKRAAKVDPSPSQAGPPRIFGKWPHRSLDGSVTCGPYGYGEGEALTVNWTLPGSMGGWW